ncbi:hypothetical protein [Devosia limi]|uniref:Uncharacterized protein n=1 Tax=Devosia limi DSM 17137 TaxID=1121477 RepID=A0A1M4SQI7_9HYPH|nr:hypothetical protein [Devosia limi]SHE34451.1 hypothetical protein SAMN02745223_00120 [Devosia limi DSM 17137]
MSDLEYTGTEFIEGFFMVAGLLWLTGGILLIAIAIIGAGTGATPPVA